MRDRHPGISLALNAGYGFLKPVWYKNNRGVRDKPGHDGEEWFQP
jgi:hypothetical protein